MSTVGDLLISAREIMTDLPQSLGAPVIGTLAAVTPFPTFPAGTYYLVATQLNQWGESVGSTEASIVLSATRNIAVPITCSPAATSIRIYWGTASGAESAYQQYAISGGSGTFTLTNLNPIAQNPPTRSTAYMPDTDGSAVGVFALYRWLNQALGWAAAKNHGGLPDFGAVGTIGGQGLYNVPGYWKKIDSAWYDGYPLGLLAKSNVFRRNPVPGYAGILVVFQASDRLIVELWPQPNRTSNITTTALDVATTDTVAALTSVANYVLGFGMTQIGAEIVNYASIDPIEIELNGLTRGMCGTVPATLLPAGATATELNLMIAGYRVPSTYAPGQAASTLYLPPGWDEALVSYMLYRFRNAEQDEASAQRYLKEASAKMADLSANRIIAGPRQINAYGGVGPETMRGLGGFFGGVIVP
jgi:hypothetical protein